MVEALKLDSGETLKAEFLGSGLFSKAYRDIQNPSIVYVCEQSYSKGKLIMETAKSLRNNIHLPRLQKLGTITERQTRKNSYTGKETVEEFTRMVWETDYSENVTDGVPASVSSLTYAHVTEKDTQKTSSLKVPLSVKEALEDIFNACAIHNTHPCWDLHEGNFAIDPATKTVILRDPISNS